jgi:hypothetical protein
MWKTIAPLLTSTCLFLAIAATAADSTARGADEKDKDTKLSLSSGYGHGLPGTRARTVHLSVRLDKKGGGKGTLTLDPNYLGIDQFGDFTGWSTAIGVRSEIVTLEEVKFKDQPKGGRRLFKVKGQIAQARVYHKTQMGPTFGLVHFAVLLANPPADWRLAAEE